VEGNPRIVLAVGDEPTRSLAAASLKRAGYDPMEVEHGVDALAAARGSNVVLVVIEIELPDMTGYEVCHAIREELGEDLPIFFISGIRTEPIDKIAGLLLGADDYVVKPIDPNELLARVRRFTSRTSVAAARNGHSERLRLTDREEEVLTLLAQGARQKEIALRLSISPKTVGTHIQNLFGKLGVHSRAELVARAYSLGLVVAQVAT
jgi:DNA-binding NarL/FixJ family response regulator